MSKEAVKKMAVELKERIFPTKPREIDLPELEALDQANIEEGMYDG